MNTTLFHSASACDELRAALATRQTPTRRVNYHATVADRIVRALRHLHPERGNVEVAIRELERALPKLPADAAHHVERALEHARRALTIEG